MRHIAGLDWSMTSPSICLYNMSKPLSFGGCLFFYLTSDIKKAVSVNNIHGFINKEYSCQEERFFNIADWAMTIMKKSKVTEACLEGYSMGSKGMVFNIAENIGLLKHMMWKNDIRFLNPAPTSVKKIFSGKGNANKQFMFDALVEREPECISLPEMLKCKSDASPLSDVVDSYAMVYYLINNLESKV